MAEIAAAAAPVARSGLVASLMRLFKMAWTKQTLWPPTRRTFPLYLGSWVALFSVIYFGYMTIICFGMFLITGLVGYSAALWFTKKIYSSIKVD